MRKALVVLATAVSVVVGTVALPAAAQASQYVPFPNASLNCTLVVATPSQGGAGLMFFGAVSCGYPGSAGLKNVNVQAAQLVSGGWQVVASTGWVGWSYANPQQTAVFLQSCVPGRWYATVAQGYATWNNIPPTYAAGNTYASGYQCP